MSDRPTDTALQPVREIGRPNQNNSLVPNNELGMHSSYNRPAPPKTEPKALQPDIQKRLDAYNALTIGEALDLAKSKRGESKKEIARLGALLEVRGVTKKTTVGEARKIREGK